MGWTVNPWLGEFEPHTRSHIKIHYGNLPAGEDTELVSGSMFLYGGSSGLRRILARFLSRRVRFPGLPPILP